MTRSRLIVGLITHIVTNPVKEAKVAPLMMMMMMMMMSFT
jgi:hypothetical protein